ncbi:polysaccharide deacetylase family protein [Ekhidna sp.]|uniref:polysaccharide deacetylase family protein n=1 Tax=Ekhidna sp. TaxID=2608089 RepID=UPI00329685E0
MIRFYKTPWFTRVLYPSCIFTIPSHNKIYLTFDDGPDPEATPWVLDELDKFNAKATFFCIGKNVELNPEITKKIVRKQHLIANHTFNHLKGWDSTDEVYIRDIEKYEKLISQFTSSKRLFRPPYGRAKRSQIRKLTGFKSIMWSHLSWDFDPSLNTRLAVTKLKKAKAGSIIVFHDSQKAFKNLKIILPEILNHFQHKGMKFDTLA